MSLDSVAKKKNCYEEKSKHVNKKEKLFDLKAKKSQKQAKHEEQNFQLKIKTA